MSKYKKHRTRWNNCNACELWETRKRVVLYRGRIPCDVLLCGEAPGPSEDVLGRPFCGPAGHLLNKMIEDSGIDKLRLGFTNLVCCIPIDPSKGEKFAQPHAEHIKACADRLEEIYKISKPKAVVCVGELAKKWVPKLLLGKAHSKSKTPLVTIGIVHPAAILRADPSQRGLAIQQTIVRLRDLAFELEA